MNKFCQKLRLLVFWLLSATVQPCVPLAAETPPAAPADVEIATAPVEIDGQVLFSVRNAWTSPAVRRAKIIRERIEAAVADRTVENRALHIPLNPTH